MHGSLLKRMLLYNIAIMVIIAFVYTAAFLPFGAPLSGNMPALMGSTGQKNIALQIAVDHDSDVAAYMDVLEANGAQGTFFFDTDSDIVSGVQARGHGVGWYTYGQATAMYIGGGYSLPVMSYSQGSRMQQVGPSIDITALKKGGDWEAVLADSLGNDLFLYISADNDFDEFEKIVQIVRDKGYTILKINEML